MPSRWKAKVDYLRAKQERLYCIQDELWEMGYREQAKWLDEEINRLSGELQDLFNANWRKE